MTTNNFIKKATFAFASLAMAAGIIFSAGTVRAIEYQGENTTPSPIPAFNVFTGVDQGVGNESDFLRARVPTSDNDTTTGYADPLNATCVAGQKIQMRVYVHNGTSVSTNENGTGTGVAHGTKVKVSLPSTEAASFTPTATISATNVATVNDNVVINCNGKTVKLRYVNGSASQYSKATGVVALSDEIVTNGVAVSSHGVAGDVWACWDERVYVILKVEVVEIPQVVTPIYSCDLLTNTGKIAPNKYSFKVDYTAKNGAVFKDITYVYNDGTTTTGGATTEHLFTNVASVKKVTATANFTVNGEVKSNTSAKCATEIPVTPTPPQVLPSTGAGSTVAVFLGTSVLGAFLYRMRALRSLL